MEEQSRRFACDRCRGHKLRCERAHGSGDAGACKRCLRVRVNCITTPSLRMGRPPSLSDKTSPSSMKQRRRSCGPVSAVSAASFLSTGAADTLSRPMEPPALSSAEGSGNTNEPVHVGRDGSTGLDFQGALDAQHQPLLQRWQSMSAFPDLSPSAAFSIDASNGNSTAAYHDGDGTHMVTTPGLNVFEFDHLFATTGSVASAVHNSTSTGASIAINNGRREPGSLPTTLPSEDSTDFAIDPYLPEENVKEECLRKLSDLSANLLQDLKRIRADRPKDSASVSSAASSISSSTSASPLSLQRFNVGRMLEHSEKFLEILQHVGGSPAAEFLPEPSPVASSVRYFDLGNDDNNFAFGSTSTTTLSQLLGDGITSSYAPSPSSPAASRGASTSAKASKDLIRPDIPTMLAVLTCYTCLIRIYDAVFSYIKTLLASPSTRQKLLPPLPGLHLCGFKLEKHQNLQLEILARVGLHMLGRIENVLDEIGRSCINSGVLEESMAANLLNMIIKQSLDVGAGGQKSDEGFLKDITKSIQELLEVKLGAK